MKRAYSVIDIKSVDEEKRIIEGIASTPTPDRMNDVVVPEGMEFSLPFPFLYQHNSRQPIGTVIKAYVTAEGMRVQVQIAKAGIAAFIDEAWNLIKAGLVRGLSIGFRSLEESWDKTLDGFRYLRTEILELSAVTIPANAEASITSIKSIACDELAAIGTRPRSVVRLDPKTNPPGASGKSQKRENMTIKEQIKSFEATRQAKSARMTELMSKAGDEGRTLNETEAQEYDGLETEVKSIDEHLVRLNKHELELAEKAIPVDKEAGLSPESASRTRGGIITMKGPDLPKGTAFVRYVIALAAAKGNRTDALEYARNQASWKDQTPMVEKFLDSSEAFRLVKAPVAAGTTTASGWASQLVNYTIMASEFIEYLRPQTIIGKLTNLRRVPFNISMPLQDSGSSSAWVGQGARKPISKLNFNSATLGFAKSASIVVFTDELLRFSNPSIEDIVRQDLARAMIQFLDGQFVDPSVTISANVHPASVTNGAAHDAASGADADSLRADFKDAISTLLAAEIDPTGAVWIMSPVLAVAISLIRNALGQKEFPDIKAEGGMLEGYGVVTSGSCASGVVTFAQPAEILLADDGGVSIDISKEASLVMDDGNSPSETTMVSMFQENKVAVRAERYINWMRRRLAAVYYLTSCNYGGTS